MEAQLLFINNKINEGYLRGKVFIVDHHSDYHLGIPFGRTQFFPLIIIMIQQYYHDESNNFVATFDPKLDIKCDYHDEFNYVYPLVDDDEHCYIAVDVSIAN